MMTYEQERERESYLCLAAQHLSGVICYLNNASKYADGEIDRRNILCEMPHLLDLQEYLKAEVAAMQWTIKENVR